MDPLVRRLSLSVVLLVAVVYLVAGLVFGELAGSAPTMTMRLTYRRLAWLVSGVAFAFHIGYGLFRLGNSCRATATHASIAAGLGAFGLAAAATVHGLLATNYRRSIALALVLWPLITAVPAFVVAFLGAWVLKRWRPPSNWKRS